MGAFGKVLVLVLYIYSLFRGQTCWFLAFLYGQLGCFFEAVDICQHHRTFQALAWAKYGCQTKPPSSNHGRSRPLIEESVHFQGYIHMIQSCPCKPCVICVSVCVLTISASATSICSKKDISPFPCCILSAPRVFSRRKPGLRCRKGPRPWGKS